MKQLYFCVVLMGIVICIGGCSIYREPTPDEIVASTKDAVLEAAAKGYVRMGPKRPDIQAKIDRDMEIDRKKQAEADARGERY